MIIFINGSINSGKSTISKLLQKIIPNTALVEVDSLREFIDWMPLQKSISLNLQNAVSVIKNFVDQKLNVIIPYPLSEKNYLFFVNELSAVNSKIIYITLAPKLKKVLQNRGTRNLTKWEKQRIQHHYDIGIANPNFGYIIDNSNQTPQQTIDEILQKINK